MMHKQQLHDLAVLEVVDKLATKFPKLSEATSEAIDYLIDNQYYCVIVYGQLKNIDTDLMFSYLLVYDKNGNLLNITSNH